MNLVADLHVHTISSGHAYNTILENTQSAREKGLKLIAITDHGPNMPGGPNKYHFGNMKVLPSIINKVEILKGVEANIVDMEGNLDLEKNFLEELDIVLAGLHDDCFIPESVEDNTKALIQTIQNPLVHIIVHPGNPRFKVDYERVVSAAAEYNVALEINNSSLTIVRKGSFDNCREIARLCKKYGTLVAFGSDAHWYERVGEFDKAMKLVEEAGIKEKYILNTSVDKIKAFLKSKKNKK